MSVKLLLTGELDFGSWVRLRKNSEPRSRMQDAYLESHRGRRIEPAGLHELRKQVTEVKEGPLELRKKKTKVYAWERRCRHVCGGQWWNWVPCLKGFYLFSKGRNSRQGLRRGSQQNIHKLARCAFQDHGLYWLVRARPGCHRSLQLALMSAVASFHLCLLLSWPGTKLRPRCYL